MPRETCSKKIREIWMGGKEGEEIYTRFERILGAKKSSVEAAVEAINIDLMLMSNKGKPPSHRINYVLRLMSQHNLIPEVSSLEEEKSDAKSEEFRILGNSYFSANPPKYIKALEEYNKSMCYAVSKENVSTAIANRSAVLISLKMYPECLESIRLAREVGVPDKLKEKLERREEMCRDRMKNVASKEKVVPEIGMPVNEKIPFIAKCLALRENDKFGKHIITEAPIPVGTVIAIEEPYCKNIIYTEKYIRCATCLLEVPHLLFPCENCTQTMFCSKDCKEKALKDFHAIECPISGSLFKLINSRSLLSFRMCVKFMLAFPDTKSMLTALEKMDKEKKNVLNFDWNHELSPEDLYEPIYTSKLMPMNFILRTYVEMCLILKMLKSSPILCQRYLTTAADENIVKNFIYRNILLGSYNGENLKQENPNNPFPNSVNVTVYGCAVSGFYNLLNHSCYPNTSLISIGSTFGLLSIKNIAAGEQIFYDYGGFHHTFKEKGPRKYDILEQCGFDCVCRACDENFPVWEQLERPFNIEQFYPHKYSLLLCSCRWSFATNKKIVQDACKYIKKYEHLSPCKQLFITEEQLRNSFEIMYNGFPFRLQEAPKCPKCYTR